MIKFKLEGEYIELFKLLKVLDLVESGAEAKLIIADGHVKRNAQMELRKRAKILSGDTVEVADVIIEVE